MDFTKLVSILDSQRLYFTRSDKFSDPFEGSYPKQNVAARRGAAEALAKEAPQLKRDALIRALTNDDTYRQWPRFVVLNCWHMNEHESAAMWNLYLKSDEGVAIQSSYARLKACFIEEEDVYLGLVQYIDYESDMIHDGNLFSPFVHKRKSFEHEKEVRAVIQRLPVLDKVVNFNEDSMGHGVSIKVDTTILIERIYIAPNAPPWFTNLVTSVVSKYGYSFEIVQSTLNTDPVY